MTMHRRAYAVFDAAVGQYMQPFFVRTEQEAIRMVANSMVEESQVYLNPGDYAMYYVGTFDTDTGTWPEIPPNPVQVQGNNFFKDLAEYHRIRKIAMQQNEMKFTNGQEQEENNHG